MIRLALLRNPVLRGWLRRTVCIREFDIVGIEVAIIRSALDKTHNGLVFLPWPSRIAILAPPGTARNAPDRI